MGTLGSDHVAYIENQLAQDGSIWSLRTWHKNQHAMQLGDKPDDVGWEAYEACREGGAIIATAHEHSYARTRTLIDIAAIDDFMITSVLINTAPVAEDQQITAAPNPARAIPLTGSDADGDPLTFWIITGPVSGILGGNSSDLTYTPDADFTGIDSFTFVASDGTADSEPATLAITVGPIQANLSFGLILDPEDGAAGLGLAISRVFDLNTNADVITAWGGYRAKLTYDGTCLNILDIREKEFSVTVDMIDNGGVAEFQGKATSGASGPSELAQVVSRTGGSSQIPCSIAVEIANLTDDGGNPIGVVPVSLAQNLLSGDALADEIVNIADAMFIAQFLAGSRRLCTTEVDPTCLHSLNAANGQPDGDFDQVTITDAVLIAQHLLGLEDVL